MGYFQIFASAMAATAFVIAIARLVLSFILPEPGNYVPSLCVGLGFLLGRYSFVGSPGDPATTLALIKFFGSAACLIIFMAGFRYQATRQKAAR